VKSGSESIGMSIETRVAREQICEPGKGQMIDIVHGNRLEAPTTRRCVAGTMKEARRNQCSCIACMDVTREVQPKKSLVTQHEGEGKNHSGQRFPNRSGKPSCSRFDRVNQVTTPRTPG
jgi:hypothetical protein